MVLYVGLGNPSSTYFNTRHNIGFRVIDTLVNKLGASNISKPTFKGELHKTSSLLFLKPLTYMNLSGQSVQAVVSYYKPEKIIVVHDDIDLCFGAMCIKKGGSSGGHNGLKSIDSLISNDYIRVRMGIGKPKEFIDIADFVLQKFSTEEEEHLLKFFENACNAMIDLEKNELKDVVAKYNNRVGKLC